MYRRSIWVLRHGYRMDIADLEWVFTAVNPHNPPLHEKGMLQAKETATYFSKQSIDWIFSSPFLRTLQTAHCVAERLNKMIRIENGFSEWLNPRAFKYKPDTFDLSRIVSEWKNKKKQFPLIHEEYRSIWREERYPESLEELDMRIEKTLHKILDQYRGNVLFVSHAAPIDSFFRILLNSNLDKFHPMCAFSRFDKVDEGWKLGVYCNSSHLSIGDTCGNNIDSAV